MKSRHRTIFRPRPRAGNHRGHRVYSQRLPCACLTIIKQASLWAVVRTSPPFMFCLVSLSFILCSDRFPLGRLKYSAVLLQAAGRWARKVVVGRPSGKLMGLLHLRLPIALPKIRVITHYYWQQLTAAGSACMLAESQKARFTRIHAYKARFTRIHAYKARCTCIMASCTRSGQEGMLAFT